LFFLVSLQTMFAQWASFTGPTGYYQAICFYDNKIYVGTSANGIWVSSHDMGGGWTRYGNNLNTANIKSIAIGTNGSYCTTSTGLYQLEGSNWVLQQYSGTNITTTSSVVIQESTGYVFTCQDHNGIFRSIDNGTTWTQYITTSANENLVGNTGDKGIIPDIRIWGIYTKGNYIYANSKNAVHISEDNGDSWYYRWGDLVVDHGTGSNIRCLHLYNYKGTDYLFVSSDGSTWNGSAPQLSRSANLGINYPVADVGTTPNMTGVPYYNGGQFSDIASYEDKVLISTNGSTLFKSLDNGLNWTDFEDQYYGSSAKKIIVAPNKRVYLADYYGLYKYDLTVTPVVAANYPKVQNITGSKVDLLVKSNKRGFAYYVVLPSTATAPTSEQIAAGLDADGNAVTYKGNITLYANSEASKTIIGLLSETNYKIYVSVRNEVNNEAPVSNLSFTTASAYLTVLYKGTGSVTPSSGYYSGSVTLSAMPGTNWRFDKWTVTGSPTITIATTNVFVNTDITATANFVQSAILSVNLIGGLGTTNPMGVSVVDIGKNYKINVYPYPNYKVSKYHINGSAFSSIDNYRNFTALAGTNTVYVELISLSNYEQSGISCDSLTAYSDLTRPDAAWEIRYKQRINTMFGNHIPNYTEAGFTGHDVGKQFWSPYLAKMAWTQTYASSTTCGYYIKNKMKYALEYHLPGAGSLWYPFSSPGLPMYYFKYRDSIAKYDPAQLDTFENTLYRYQEWKYMMRKDHYFDMIYPDGKEFNSENFHWMLRSAGHLFAHEFHNKNGHNNYSANFIDVDGTPRTNVNLIKYFDGYLNNLTRALYSAGRVEWNSNNYWGHTVNPLITLYECADKCNNPEGLKMKKQAKACLDWMMIEAAIHYLDGFEVMADTRGKSGYANPFSGSLLAYTYPFFVDDSFHPTFPSTIWQTKSTGDTEIGYLLNTDYRPPQIVIDIAQRKFTLPVEIQSAKPFYHIDNGDFWQFGEAPYNDWRGNTSRSKRFEFETIYLGKNFTMSSNANARPDGNMGTYSEQAVWEIGIKGSNNGALEITGNATNYSNSPAGRSPYHEVGQFRNAMVHLVKKPSSNQFFVIIPDANNQLTNSGSGAWHEWSGNNLYLDMGNDVYVSLRAYASTSHSTNTSPGIGSNHTQITWNFTSNQLGGLVIELGTKDEFGSFTNFKTISATKTLNSPATNVIYTETASSNSIRMEFVAPITFSMYPGTNDTPYINPFSPAGTTPKLWGNGAFIDYTKWDSYKTVYGTPLINQKWGGCTMTLQTNDKFAKITIDSLTAEVEYKMKDANHQVVKPDFSFSNTACGGGKIEFTGIATLPADVSATAYIWDVNNDKVWEGSGQPYCAPVANPGNYTVSMNINAGKNCYKTTKTVYLDVLTLSDEDTKNSGFDVYPNPVNDKLKIVMNNPFVGKSNLKITDYSGKVLKDKMIEKTSEQLLIEEDLSELPSGVYLIVVQQNSKTYKKVIVKQ